MNIVVEHHSMDFIKPEPDGEHYWTSHSENQLIYVKEEEDPLLIRLPQMKAENEVSCMCVCSVRDIHNHVFGICSKIRDI
jgi:hypothetical protein